MEKEWFCVERNTKLHHVVVQRSVAVLGLVPTLRFTDILKLACGPILALSV